MYFICGADGCRFEIAVAGIADTSDNYYLTVEGFKMYCQAHGEEGIKVRNLFEQLVEELSVPTTAREFLDFIADERMANGNLSIRGTARCCGVAESSFSQKYLKRRDTGNYSELGQRLMDAGFEPDTLIKNGFPPQAVWLCIEYFAFDSKAEALLAKQLARTFGCLGVMQVLENPNQLVTTDSDSNAFMMQMMQQQSEKSEQRHREWMAQQQQQFQLGLAQITNSLNSKVEQVDNNVTKAKEQVAAVKQKVEQANTEAKAAREEVKQATKNTVLAKGYETVSSYLEGFSDILAVSSAAVSKIGSYLTKSAPKHLKHKHKVKLFNSKYPANQWKENTTYDNLKEMLAKDMLIVYIPKKKNSKYQLKTSDEVNGMKLSNIEDILTCDGVQEIILNNPNKQESPNAN